MLVKGKQLRIDLCASSPHDHPDLVDVVPVHPGQIEKHDLTDHIPKTIGISPSQLDDHISSYLEVMSKSMHHKSVIAVGPIGIDKALAQSTEKQQEIFEEQLKIAKSFKKPVILTIGNAYREIIDIREKDNERLPWIFLNFNQSDIVAGDLFKMNGYFSFGTEIFNPASKILLYLDLFPPDRIFFDTYHATEKSIDDIYKKAATMLEMEQEKLQQQIVINFNAVFGDPVK